MVEACTETATQQQNKVDLVRSCLRSHVIVAGCDAQLWQQAWRETLALTVVALTAQAPPANEQLLVAAAAQVTAFLSYVPEIYW